MSNIIYAEVNGCFAKLSSNIAGVKGDCNATSLYVKFSEDWDNLSKRILWTDASCQNTVSVILSQSEMVDGYCTSQIPAEPLSAAGWCGFVMEGYKDSTPNVIAHSVMGRMKVYENCIASTDNVPADPTPAEALQLQGNIDTLNTDYANFKENTVHNFNNKVDKIDGKSLSSNDYTSAEQEKLRGIEEGAEVNQNAFSEIHLVNGSTVNTSIKPTANDKNSVLKIKDGDALTGYIWDNGPNYQMGLQLMPASHANRGTMSSDDKAKLDGVAAGAEVNQNAFSKLILKNGPESFLEVPADTKQDQMMIEYGASLGFTISKDVFPVEGNYKGTKRIWLNLLEASASNKGVMSPSMFKKLDGIDANLANNPPYIGDNSNWFLYDTNTGAYADTGVCAKGIQGETGTQGNQGIQGDKGEAGEDGKSAYQIACEKGFSGTEEEWIASLKGEKGADGMCADLPSNLVYYEENADEEETMASQNDLRTLHLKASGSKIMLCFGEDILSAITISGGSVSADCTSVSLNQTLVQRMKSTISPTTLLATVLPSDCTQTVLWASSDESVATVSGGVITCVSAGDCTITATCVDMSASCRLHIMNVVQGGMGYSSPNLMFNNYTDRARMQSFYAMEKGKSYKVILSDTNFWFGITEIGVGIENIPSVINASTTIACTMVQDIGWKQNTFTITATGNNCMGIGFKKNDATAFTEEERQTICNELKIEEVL